jgi:hypothetical protein
MATSEANRAVHRLVDMVVEEVSLVDRAANQHRFLIVKRSEPMDQNTAPAQAATYTQPGDETAPTAAEETPTDLNEQPDADSGETLDADSPEVLGSDAGTEQPSAFALATQALQSLTAAVQMLASVPKGEARDQIAELARQLGATGLAGSDEASRESASPPADDEEDTAQKASLPVPRGASGQPDAVNTKLDSIAAGLRALGETMKQHQRRLAQVEKRFGLPNSSPSGEHQAKPQEPEGIGWPLDLNRSLDRDSVDKSVSFHDV